MEIENICLNRGDNISSEMQYKYCLLYCTVNPTLELKKSGKNQHEDSSKDSFSERVERTNLKQIH